MDIKELLQLRGLNTDAKIKMMRHMSKTYDVYDMYRRGHLETYQSFQSKPVLQCDYLVSFLGIRHGCARFIGVYKVGKRISAREVKLDPEYPYQEFTQTASYWYDLIKEPGYEDLIDRVVISWGHSQRSWHQWLAPKEIIEILPKGYVRDFPGLLDLNINFIELQQIVANPAANREWHLMLKSVAGVYLILAEASGKQYVGSAYGSSGIFGRWKVYADTGHGGNSMLQSLINKNPRYPMNFRFSILHTLSKGAPKDEVIRYETIFKKKLGTRAFGLNSN